MNFNASITTPSVNVNIPTPVVTPVVPPVVPPVVTPVVPPVVTPVVTPVVQPVVTPVVQPTITNVVVHDTKPITDPEAECCVLAYFTLIFCFICRIFVG